MTRPNPSTALAEVLVDELARNGVSLVVISPGSRSAALAIAAAGHPDLETVVVIDERSAAFHALGRAKATGRPAAVIATSGTAPANWYPAVIEAGMSVTPLILVSADRPLELHGIGANQTVDQVGLFGDRVRHFTDIGAAGDEDVNPMWRSLVCEAVAHSRGRGGLPGPVHVNVAFREPTVPVGDDGRTRSDPFTFDTSGKADGGPWLPPVRDEAPGDDPTFPESTRGLVVAGDGEYDRDGLKAEASRLGWPVLATALSGMRGEGVIDCYHHLLAGGPIPAITPDLVMAIGHTGPSDRLDSLFAAAKHRVRVDAWGRSIDPGRNATLRVRADPVGLLTKIGSGTATDHWAASWEKAAGTVRSAIAGWLEDNPRADGAHVVSALDRVGWGCLVVGSSLPIREVDAHLTRAGRVIANRGTSGVDGFVSTALGVASAVEGTVALTGDLGLLHDANGYLSEDGGDLPMVVMVNGGGGLFDSLPLADHAPSFERLFITPHHRRMSDVAALHHLDHTVVNDTDDLAGVIERHLGRGGRSLIEVTVDRALDLDTRRALDAVAGSALESIEP